VPPRARAPQQAHGRKEPQPFVTHGPHPGRSACERNGSAVSWCHTTSQLAWADLSNRVARYGWGSAPRTVRAMDRRRGSRAIAATWGCAMRCRAPALERATGMRATERSAISGSPTTPGWIAKPGSALFTITYDGSVVRITLRSAARLRRLRRPRPLHLIVGRHVTLPQGESPPRNPS
jgi:hypothetical protein